jgi:hypothetical protein
MGVHGNRTIFACDEFLDEEEGGEIHTIVEFLAPFCCNFFDERESCTVNYRDMDVNLILIKKDVAGQGLELQKDQWGWFNKSEVIVDFPTKIFDKDDERWYWFKEKQKFFEEIKASDPSLIIDKKRKLRGKKFDTGIEKENETERFWREKIANPNLIEEDRRKNWQEYHDKLIEEALSKKSIVLEMGIEVFNRFLDQLTFFMDVYYFNNVGYNDVLKYSCKYTQGGDIKYNYNVDVSKQSFLGRFERGNEYEELQEKIGNALRNNEQLSISNRLMIEAKRNLDRENYNLAIINSVSALDVYVSKLISDKLNEKIRDEEVVILLKKRYWRLHERLSKLFNYAYGESFISKHNGIWAKLSSGDASAIELRNRIIHKGFIATSDAAKDVIETVKTTINLLKSYEFQSPGE